MIVFIDALRSAARQLRDAHVLYRKEITKDAFIYISLRLHLTNQPTFIRHIKLASHWLVYNTTQLLRKGTVEEALVAAADPS